MEPYDPTLEALIAAMLDCLAPDADVPGGYIEQLQAIAYAIQQIMRGAEAPEPTSEQEQLMRQALGMLDAKAGDAELAYLEVLRRLQSAVDRELFKWDSSLVQPIGWSGDAQVAIGGSDFAKDDTGAVPENWNRRLQQV